MPRLARLDIAGLLQHVIVRGIERRDIFNYDHDRQLFFDRFVKLLSETGVRCYAWALLSNHFHLLLMPTSTPLSSFMDRGTLLVIFLLTLFSTGQGDAACYFSIDTIFHDATFCPCHA